LTMQFRPEVLNVKESPLVRIATVAEHRPDSHKLCYGESDMPTPEFICRASYEASLAGHTFYTYPGGCVELREAIREKFQALQGVEYDTDEVVCTVGAGMAIFLAVRALVGPGDNAIVICPAYSIFTSAITMSGGETRPVPLLREGDRFCLDLDRVRSAVDSRTRMLIINSPSNPTGWVISREEQEAIWLLATEHNFMILSDEIYDRLVFDGPVAPSFARVATDRDHLIVVNGFSKSYTMTGWRLGYGLAGERLIALMTKAGEFMTSSPPAMVQQAGIVALRDGEDYVGQIRGLYSERRNLVMERLRGVPQVSLPPPDGGFYAFIEVEGLRDSLAFAERLVNETGVALAPGSAFGQGGEGYLRLCFASSEEILKSALARFDEFMRRRETIL